MVARIAESERVLASDERKRNIKQFVQPHLMKGAETIQLASDAVALFLTNYASGERLDGLDDARERLCLLRSWMVLQIQDTWLDVFRDSIIYARTHAHPDDLRAGGGIVSRNDVNRCKQTLIGGKNAYDALGKAFDLAVRRAKTTADAMRGANARRQRSILASYLNTAFQLITTTYAGVLMTGAYRQDVVAQKLVLKPELLHDDPTILP